MSSVGKRDVRCPHRLAFVAQPGVAQRLSHRGSVSQFRQNATVTTRSRFQEKELSPSASRRRFRHGQMRPGESATRLGVSVPN